jgi:hypothetical protein
MWTTVITDVKHNRLSHTSTQVGSYLFILGGHNGQSYAQDVLLFNLGTFIPPFRALHFLPLSHPRQKSKRKEREQEEAGSRNQEGKRKKELIIVTLQWEAKIPKGQAPPGRGYHVALLHDARIFISGGYNGVSVFDDLWALDLSAAAYLPQVVCLFLSSFSSFILLFPPTPSPPFCLRFATSHHPGGETRRKET